MEKSTGNREQAGGGKKRRLPYVVLDVFTRRPLQGNQLAVFTDARGLADDEMQALARETNLSETTFVIPRAADVEQEQGVKVRIFTVEEELPFAGHPTLGTATALRNARSGSQERDRIVLDLRVGKIPVTFRDEADGGIAFGEMRQRDPIAGAVHSKEEIARAANLRLEDFDPELPAQTFSTGLAYTIVPLRSLEVARELNLTWSNVAEYLARGDGKFFYFVTRETVNPKARLHARMIFYSGEDPATGSAAGCAAAWMVAHGVAKSNEQVMIEQGLEIKRTSEMYVRAELRKQGGENRIENVRCGGYAVEIAHGEVLL